MQTHTEKNLPQAKQQEYQFNEQNMTPSKYNNPKMEKGKKSHK